VGGTEPGQPVLLPRPKAEQWLNCKEQCSLGLTLYQGFSPVQEALSPQPTDACPPGWEPHKPILKAGQEFQTLTRRGI
jgi:hypothetical protein